MIWCTVDHSHSNFDDMWSTILVLPGAPRTGPMCYKQESYSIALQHYYNSLFPFCIKIFLIEFVCLSLHTILLKQPDGFFIFEKIIFEA